jgi:hypothetical protein
MKSQNYTMVKLEPYEGDWKEITDTEYKKLKAEQDEKIAEKMAKMEEK